MSTNLLFRSMVGLKGSDTPIYAFVVAASPEAAQRKLQAILPPILATAPTAIRIVFTSSERELLDRSVGPTYTRDARLLEIGLRGEGRRAYASADQTLLLVPPAQLARLQQAQRQAVEWA